VKLFSHNSNLYDHDTSTSQTDRRRERRTTCHGNTALRVASRGNNSVLWFMVAGIASREPSYREVSAQQQCVYEGPYGKKSTFSQKPHPRTNQHVDRQSGCKVMAIFENVKNIRYRYQRLRLQLINLNYGSI